MLVAVQQWILLTVSSSTEVQMEDLLSDINNKLTDLETIKSKVCESTLIAHPDSCAQVGIY